MKKKSLSVVIITKDREHSLLECLSSVFSQSMMPTEIVIVNNSVDEQVNQRLTSLAKVSLIPLKILKEQKSSYPVLRNKALQAAKGDWIVSIDDDCVADVDWLKHFLSTIYKYPNAAFLMGASTSYNQKNPFSLATELFESMWKENNIFQNKIMNLDILDTKNVAFNKNFFRIYRLEFDQAKSDYLGAAEDSDLGLQIARAGGEGRHVPTAKVLHKNPTDFQSYFSKLKLRYDTRKILNKKWGSSTGSYFPKKPQQFYENFNKLKLQSNLSFIETALFFLVSFSRIYTTVYWKYPRLFSAAQKLSQYV